MDFTAFSKTYAAEIGGDFREYDDTQSIIIIPLNDGRFQTVIGEITHHEKYNRDMVQIKSTVCAASETIPFEEILQESANYPYAKFFMEENHLKLGASTFLDDTSENTIKEMFSSIAQLADDWEFRITGKDIH